MRAVAYFFILVALTSLPSGHAAPAPKRTPAKPAIIEVKANVGSVVATIENGAVVGIRENKEVANLLIVRQQKDLPGWVEKNLHVERAKDTNHIKVSFQEGNAKEQAAIINAVVEHYLKTYVAEERNRLRRQAEAFNELKALLIAGQAGKLREDAVAKAEALIQQCEADLKTLPSLVEQAKAP